MNGLFIVDITGFINATYALPVVENCLESGVNFLFAELTFFEAMLDASIHVSNLHTDNFIDNVDTYGVNMKSIELVGNDGIIFISIYENVNKVIRIA